MYKLTKSTDSITGITTEGDTIIRTTDRAAIPIDSRNRDYQDYLDFSAASSNNFAATVSADAEI